MPVDRGTKALAKPVYEVSVWPEDGLWLARVVGASDGADLLPLGLLTDAGSSEDVESMARDMIATVLDVGEDAFGCVFRVAAGEVPS